MNAILNLGKYLYGAVMAIFGLGHLGNANAMAGMVPIPGGAIWVYLTGLALIAAAVSIFIGKMDKLAATLLALMLVIFALSIHLPGMMGAADDMAAQMSMGNMMKDLGLAGAALIYAKSAATDNAIIG